MDREEQVTIIGAGPAGIASAIFLHRAGRTPLLLERCETGGLLRNANLVENYPGFPGGIRGPDLVRQFTRQMDMLGIHAVKAGATLVKVARDGFRIDTTTCSVLTRSLILATGTSPKRLSCPGIASLMGDRVFSEIVEMPLAMIRRKRIVVIGGGDAAFDYAMNLTERGAYVTIIARSEPECLPLLRARAEANKITVVIGVAVDRMQRTDGKVTVRCRDNSGARELLADYILVACGREPNMDVLSPSLRKRTGKMKRIPETGVPGLFIAGDVTRGKHRQTTIAVGDGVLAAMMVDEYLRGEEVSR